MKDYINKYRDLFLLSFLVFIALALRLYRITEQSIWHEEFVLIANARICDFITNIQLLLLNATDYGISPGSAILYYFWINLFPEHIWVWRLLPIFFGIFSIILLYYFGKTLYDEKVGFLSGLIMTLSPLNIYIHQELKMYSFLLFFSLLSWFCFYKYIFDSTKNKYWLLLGGITNILLPWFHAVYICVPMLQFIVIILLWKKTHLSHKISWFLFVFVSVFLYGLWLIYLNPSLNNVSDYQKEKIDFIFIITTLFGNDCVSFSNELLPEWKTNELNIIHSKVWKILFEHWFYIDISLLTLIVSCFIIFFVYNIKYKRQILLTEEGNVFLFIFILLLPVSFLILRFVTNLSVFLTLYFLYFLPVVYVVISYTVLKILPGILKISFYVFIILLYMLQCLSVISFTTRPDYKNAVSYIEENAKKDDIILDLQLGTNYFDVWKIYKNREDIKFRTVLTPQCIADIAYDTISRDNKTIWVLMETSILTWFYNYDPTVFLIKTLKPFGMKISLKHFPGKFNIYVVKIEKENYIYDIGQYPQLLPVSNIDYKKLVDEIIGSVEEDEQKKKYEKLIKKYITIWPPIYPFHNIVILDNILSEGNLDFAKVFLNYLIKKYPSWNLLYDLDIALQQKMDEDFQLEGEKKYKLKNSFLNYFFYVKLQKSLLSDNKLKKDMDLINGIKEKGLCIICNVL